MKAKITTVERDFRTKPQKSFLDMIAPSVIKFYTDYFICGATGSREGETKARHGRRALKFRRKHLSLCMGAA